MGESNWCFLGLYSSFYSSNARQFWVGLYSVHAQVSLPLGTGQQSGRADALIVYLPILANCCC